MKYKYIKYVMILKMSEIIYTSYSQKYESDLFSLWNKCLTADPISIEQLRFKMLFDENFDEELCQIAIKDNHLIGICYGVKRKFPYLERGLQKEKAWISFIIVDPKYQRQGIGSTLLDRCEKLFISRDTKEIIVAMYSPNYFFSGVNTEVYKGACLFFEKHGYNKTEQHFAMSKDLTNFELSSETQNKLNELNKKGYHFELFSYKYSHELLQFALKEFGAGWKRNCLLGMQSNRADKVTTLVLDKDNKIVGFSTRMIDNDPTRFGPIGVAESVRNEGIGGVLFDISMLNMKKQGINKMHFLSTEENGKRFYLRHGVKVEQINQGYTKIIK